MKKQFKICFLLTFIFKINHANAMFHEKNVLQKAFIILNELEKENHHMQKGLQSLEKVSTHFLPSETKTSLNLITQNLEKIFSNIVIQYNELKSLLYHFDLEESTKPSSTSSNLSSLDDLSESENVKVFDIEKMSEDDFSLLDSPLYTKTLPKKPEIFSLPENDDEDFSLLETDLKTESI